MRAATTGPPNLHRATRVAATGAANLHRASLDGRGVRTYTIAKDLSKRGWSAAAAGCPCPPT
jgi:hypothetical protein